MNIIDCRSLVPVSCEEQTKLTTAVIIAACKVQEAQIRLGVAREKRETRRCSALLQQAREEEQRALEALDRHERKHRCEEQDTASDLSVRLDRQNGKTPTAP